MQPQAIYYAPQIQMQQYPQQQQQLRGSANYSSPSPPQYIQQPQPQQYRSASPQQQPQQQQQHHHQQQQLAPQGSMTMSFQSGMVPPSSGFASSLDQRQHTELNHRHAAEHEVRSSVHWLNQTAERMYTQMRSAPASLFTTENFAQGQEMSQLQRQRNSERAIKNKWLVSVCGGCGPAYTDPPPGTGLQNTIAQLTQMDMAVGKIINNLTMSTKHLAEEVAFMATLASCFHRVQELINLMARYQSTYVCDCCACFSCCRTTGFGGHMHVSEIAIQLRKKVLQVKTDNRLDMNFAGVNRVSAQHGQNAQIDTRSTLAVNDVGTTRVIVQNQGQTVGMGDTQVHSDMVTVEKAI